MPHNKKIGPEQPGYYAESKSAGSDTRHPKADGETNGDELDQLSKDELLEKATQLGVTPANAGMTKQELIDGIKEHSA